MNCSALTNLTHGYPYRNNVIDKFEIFMFLTSTISYHVNFINNRQHYNNIKDLHI